MTFLTEINFQLPSGRELLLGFCGLVRSLVKCFGHQGLGLKLKKKGGLRLESVVEVRRSLDMTRIEDVHNCLLLLTCICRFFRQPKAP